MHEPKTACPMIRDGRARLLALLLAMGWLCMPLALSGCGDDEPVTQQNFAPLDYGFLAKLRLNVGSIDVQDHSSPLGATDVAALSPSPPADALTRMARDRLFAAGTSGSAVFVIDQASIVRGPGGALDGQLAVHLDMLTEGGRHAGFAEARDARQHVPGSDGEDQRAALYAISKQMMDDMNVELEFQVRRSLKEWLETAGSVPAPVTAQPLPGSVPPPLSAPGIPTSPAGAPAPLPPAAVPPVSDDAPQQTPETPGLPPPIIMSPPPGTLQLPPASGY